MGFSFLPVPFSLTLVASGALGLLAGLEREAELQVRLRLRPSPWPLQGPTAGSSLLLVPAEGLFVGLAWAS